MSSCSVKPAAVQPTDLTVEKVAARMARHQVRVDELLRRYPVKRGALLQILWLVQEEFAWVPRVAIQWAAGICAVSPVHAFGVVEFYTMYKQVPRGRHLIQVCQTMCCFIQGSEDLIAHLEKSLGVHSGETTKDGLFTLVRVECLALCGTGPGVMIDDEAIGPHEYEQWPDGFHPTPEVLDRWIARLRKEAEGTPTAVRGDFLGGIVLHTKGHPGAVGAQGVAQKPGYAPAPPALKVAAVAADGGAVGLSWANAPECAKLVVERSDDGGTTWRELASVGPKDQKAADTLPAGATAHYRIIAHEKERVARPSVVVTATGKPPAPAAAPVPVPA